MQLDTLSFDSGDVGLRHAEQAPEVSLGISSGRPETADRASTRARKIHWATTALVCHVLGVRPQVHMAGITTDRIIARVTDVQFARITVGQKPGDSRSDPGLPAKHEPPVAAEHIGQPGPACVRRAACDFGPEPIHYQSFGHSNDIDPSGY